jgi:hypothetical protein
MNDAPKKRGRKPGVGSGPRADSLHAKLAPLAVGESLWFETTAEDYVKLQRQATMASRFPIAHKERRYTTATFTAVRVDRLGDVRVLVRIERIA